MKLLTLKDKLWGGLVILLLIVVFIGQIRSPKTDTSKFEAIQNKIDLKLDSISKKEYNVNIQKLNIESLEKSILLIQKDIKLLNAKTKKDTVLVNTYSDSTINNYFRTRYNY